MKTRLFFLVALLLIISQKSWAEIKASGSCGENVNYTVETTDGGNTYKVTISGTGWMADFDYYASPNPILPPWNDIRSKITAIEVEEGVHSIGNHAFMECNALTSLRLPSTLEKIGSLTFYACSSLSAVSLPEGFKWLDQAAFHSCTSLKSLVIPSTMTYIPGEGFANCSSLESVTLPSTLTAIYYKGFGDCTKLSDVNIPDGVTFIGDWAFSNTAIPTIFVPGGVKRIGMAAFQCNPNVTKVVVAEGVEEIGGGAFGVCHNLSTVILPSTIHTIESTAFMAWQKLKDFYIYSTVVPNLSSDVFLISYDEGHPDDMRGVTLHVPEQALAGYKNANVWADFGKIIALTSSDPDPSSISEVYSKAANGVYNDLLGRRIATPHRGLYIKNGKKVVVRQ
jgi:hypothetical protein